MKSPGEKITIDTKILSTISHLSTIDTALLLFFFGRGGVQHFVIISEANDLKSYVICHQVIIDVISAY